jgi:hypothetical protein
MVVDFHTLHSTGANDMGAEFESRNFGSSEALLRFVQERSEDIDRVEIYGPGAVLTTGGERPYRIANFIMLLHFMSGEKKMISRDDAEILLNDGILNRMRIKIEFAILG